MRDVSVDEVEITDLRVVSVRDYECLVAFDATVSYSAYVSYDDPDSAIVDSSEGIYVPIQKKKTTVSDFSEMSGVSKLRFDSSWRDVEELEVLYQV